MECCLLLLLFLKFNLLWRQCLCVCDYYVSLFGSLSASLLADALHLVIEGLLLFEVAHLIVVSLGLEVVPLLLGKRLPLLTDLLHNLESAHLRVGFYYYRTSLYTKMR